MKDGTGASASSIAAVRSGGRKFRRLSSRRVRWKASVSVVGLQWCDASGHRRRITRGERLLVERRTRKRRGRHWLSTVVEVVKQQ